ncbi:flagellar assembly protein FliH [Paenibacillaceae bacterium WGS1546]|uniref:flagellar assembly protein FliH n=1 Tax=Cohnella sp. WGS1546 TaxID=3366810 RepID=UPI00372D3948
MSNLIKSSHVVSLEDLKRLEWIRKIAPVQQNISPSDEASEGNPEIDVETQSIRDRILADAEHTAEQILQQARQEAERIRAEAERAAEEWWRTRRDEDERIREEARGEGREEGYRAGAAEAEERLGQEWESRLQEARTIVLQAYEAKEAIVTEGETFLVELSCSIAEKILNQKLAEAPEWSMKLFEKALARRKEQGVIVLCVSPSQFAFVQAAKDELSFALDAQAELQIVPDPSIKDGGCIVRSAFGSIDARVDTQLETIREQLLKVASYRGEEGQRDAVP